jgi:hypothetical protein
MKLLLGLFHFTMFIFGASIILDNVKHPNILMLINRIIIVIYLINYLK